MNMPITPSIIDPSPVNHVWQTPVRSTVRALRADGRGARYVRAKTGGPERSQLRMIKSSGYRKTKDHIDRFLKIDDDTIAKMIRPWKGKYNARVQDWEDLGIQFKLNVTSSKSASPFVTGPRTQLLQPTKAHIAKRSAYLLARRDRKKRSIVRMKKQIHKSQIRKYHQKLLLLSRPLLVDCAVT